MIVPCAFRKLPEDRDKAMPQYDLIVVGAGSGGTGAAITAAREGMRVLWIEKEAKLGGTGVNAYVNVWQPAFTASSLAREIGQGLVDEGEAQFLRRHTDTPAGYPIYRASPDARYEHANITPSDDLQQASWLVYSPDGMDAVIRRLAEETGRIVLWDRSTFLNARIEQGVDGVSRIAAVQVQKPCGRQTVTAPWFIDATADIHLARRAGWGWNVVSRARRIAHSPRTRRAS